MNLFKKKTNASAAGTGISDVADRKIDRSHIPAASVYFCFFWQLLFQMMSGKIVQVPTSVRQHCSGSQDQD